MAANDSPGCNLMRCLHSAALKGKSHIAAVASTIQRLDSALASCPDILNAAQLAQFGLIRRLHTKGQAALRTLPDAAERDGTLGAFGGSYDSALHWSVMAGSANPLDAGHELDALVALKRRLLIASTTVAMHEIGDPARIRDIAVDLHKKVSDLEGGSGDTPKTLTAMYDEHLESPFQSIPTGWQTLDAMMSGGGFNPTDFIIVTGREGLGKTTFTLNMLLGLGQREGSELPRTILYEMEMPAFQIAQKSLAICSGVETWKLDANQRPALTEEELTEIDGARGHVDRALHCEDEADSEIDRLIARMTADLNKHKYDVFCIDILQELYMERELSPSHAVETICKRLRRFAKQHKVVVILLAHLRKTKKEDQDAPPTLADLKGGGIAGSATMALALHSPTYNMPGEKRAVEDVDIHIVKNRMGKRGVVKFQWIPATGEYREWRPR